MEGVCYNRLEKAFLLKLHFGRDLKDVRPGRHLGKYKGRSVSLYI